MNDDYKTISPEHNQRVCPTCSKQFGHHRDLANHYAQAHERTLREEHSCAGDDCDETFLTSLGNRKNQQYCSRDCAPCRNGGSKSKFNLEDMDADELGECPRESMGASL